MTIITGLSGNELYCMREKGFEPGNLVIGNSVFALGVVGGIASGLRTIAGGEIHEITSIIKEGRQLAYLRMVEEARRHVGEGVTGVTSQLIFHDSNIEYLAIGSTIHRVGEGKPHAPDHVFSTSANGQALYCQLDCGFEPVQFVFGNVAYALGLAGGIMGSLRSMKSGEVIEYSQMLNKTRHLALQRIAQEAKEAGANAVLGIETLISPLAGIQEMLMTGTASYHADLPKEYMDSPITSDLTNEEMWNVIHAGYCPIKLVLGVSVFSIGIAGGIKAMFKSFVRGEVKELTYMIYQARLKAINMIQEDAVSCGADDVVGVKTYVYDLGGGVIELIAIGTAIKKMPKITNKSAQIIPQAIIKDTETFTNKVPTWGEIAQRMRERGIYGAG